MKSEIEQLLFDDTILNPKEKVVAAIKNRIIKNDGYCPCDQGDVAIEDTLCPCKKYRESHYCCCSLYIEKN